MAIASKKVSSKKYMSSMKDALGNINSNMSNVNSKVKKNIDLREIIWNYPIVMVNVFKKLIPFSYVILFGIIGISSTLLIQSDFFLKAVNGSGQKDSYIEGSIGAISSFNPLFVSNNYLDRSVQSLVFDKFINIDSEGNPVSGIAKSWTVSEDNLSYDFVIDSNKYWHDGTKLTVDDVKFTFDTAIKLFVDYGYDSVGSSIEGVEIEKIDETTIRFKLDEVNPTFFQAISVYIVPKARLESVDLSQLLFDSFTKYPIGSGKYEIVKTEEHAVYLKDSDNDSWDPQINTITFKVFADKESLEMSFRIGALDAIGGWDKELFDFTEEYTNLAEYEKKESNRSKLLFFNMRKDSLKDKGIRQALNYLLNKESLLADLGAGGYPLNGPIPQESWAYNSNIEYYTYNPQKAAELLKGIGYTKNEGSGFYESSNGEILNFTVSYFDNLTNERLVSLLVEYYKKEGIVLKGEKLTYRQLTQEIIATRDFELLLYEVETTIDPDQYSLWHSLKTNYPDLNLSGYDYERVDILLEDARKTSDKEVRKQKYVLFQKYLIADSPAIFLYNPSFIYYVKDDLKGVNLEDINYSFERFHNVEDWYWEE